MSHAYKNPDYPNMSSEQKAAYLNDARKRGGRTRCTQESMQDARSRGFWRTMETHPFFAMKYLKRRINAQARVRRIQSVLATRPLRKRRPM